MSSPNHDDLAHLKIPLQDIVSATNNFSFYNLYAEDASEKDYEGQLLWSGELINIFVRRLNKEWFDGDQQFWMEVSMLSTLKHKNLVSLVGFCDENDESVHIYKRERGSLSSHLRDPMSLTWVRRLEISVGIAHALSYIHYDESRDFSIIHRNIDSPSIFLNDDWEPKLGDFIRSMKIKASERHNSFNTDKVWSTGGYTDPTYIETKSAHHKSDMYSFGIVMFELLCGREAVIEDDQDNKYLASVAVTHYREKKLNEIIDWGLRQQMDSQSFNMFAEIAYDCLKEERSQRPDIDEIVPRLVKALELARENMPVYQPLVYQNRPQSLSSMAQDRIMRSQYTGDLGAKSVEGAPGFEAVGAPKNPSLFVHSGADTSEYQPLVYHNRPQSLSSMAQDRIMRSQYTGDLGAKSVEELIEEFESCF